MKVIVDRAEWKRERKVVLSLPQTTWPHLRFFAETIGPRPVGSAPYYRAADYIRREFHEAGLRIEELQYECVDWQHGSTLLECSGEPLTAVANAFSPACNVTAPTVGLCTLAELETADLKGKIALFYGDLSATPLIPLNCNVYNAERDQRINRLLAEKQPTALIAINLNVPAVDSIIEDADLEIASATAPAEVGLHLLAHVGESVHLKIDARRTPARATTIVGRKDGPSPARVSLMAHFDTKVSTPGATDNGGGVATLLTLVDLLSREAFPFGLEFIAFGDEEYYAYSDGLYVENYGDEMKEILAAINMDGVGQRLGTNTITLMTASEQFRQLLDGILVAYPGVTWTDPWPQSNHATFAWRGVPSIALSSKGVANVHHQPWDESKWLDEGKLSEVLGLIVDIIGKLRDKSASWTRGS